MSKKKTMSLADLFNRLINQVKRTMKQSSYKNRNVRRGAQGYRAVRKPAVGKPAVRNNTRAMPPKLIKPSLSNYLNSPFYRTKTPDQSKLKNQSGTQQEKNNKERPISMRGNKRTGSYNGKFHDIDYSGKIITRTRAVHDRYNDDTLSDPADFFKGNIKQTLGGFESAIGTIRKNIGGYNWLDASREEQKAFSEEMKNKKNVTKEEVKKAWDESRKKGIAVAEEMKKKGDDTMADHADKLLASGSADLERVKKGKNAVQRTLVDLASSVTQFGIDAGLGAVTGGGILPIMAIRSGGTAASEARQEGATDLEQLLYGSGKGTLDVLTEKTMSLVKPLTTVMKKGALDDYSEKAINKLLKSQIMDKVIKSPEGKNITYHALRAGAAATGEGAEEMLAEALTTPLKNAIYTDGEKIDVKSVLYSGLQGALTGVALGGAGATADYHQGKNLVKNKGYDDKNNVVALIDEGLQSDESTPANKIAKQLKLVVESGKEVAPGQILAQKRANQEAIKQEAFAIERHKYIAERAAERKGLSPVTVDIDNNRTIIGGATAQRLKETTGRVSERLIDAHSMDKETALDTAASISRIAVGLGDERDFSALLPTAGNESARQIYMEETGSALPNTNEGTRAVLSKSNMMNRLMMRQEETKFQKAQQKQKIMREAETSLGKNGLSAFSNTLQLSKGKSNSSVMQEFKKYYDGGIANYPVENIYRMSKYDHLPYPARMAAWQAGYRDSESRMQAQDAGKSSRSARYSINYTSENQPVVILDKDILENVPEENWKSTVRDEMKKFSEGIPVHGKLIKVNAKGRKEFTKGKTTEFYRKNNETVYKDKLNSGSNADEIVWASTDYTNENPKHLRKDDFVDFARGKVLLQSGENKYNASVIIGKRSNGELALYDVVDYKPADFVLKSSKKDADPQFKENNSYRRSYAASSNNSISNSALKNNRNELKQKNSGTFKSQVSLRVVPKKTQDCLKNLAKALNVDIQLDPVLKHDANGFYKDGVIHLSAKTDNPVLSVFKHELTHHIQETAPVEYQKLKEFVMQEYYKGDRKTFQAAIDEKVQAYAKQGERLTRDQAIDEIIANSAERFLIDEAEIAKVVRQDRSLGQAILDAIRNMIESIKGLMQGRSKELDVLKRAEKLWGDALKVSVENEANTNSSAIKYSRKTQRKDIVSIKEQIKQNIHALNKMEPVARIKSEGFRGKTDKQILDDVVGEYKKYGMGVDRQDFGFISLEEALVNNSLNYLSTEAEYAAFSTLPRVLKRGMEIRDKEHKGRGHNTVTFAAPVAINGKVGIVGVVVKKTKGNRYKTHRIVMPDGSAYVFEHNKTEATTAGMTDTKNGEGPTITSVSKNSISNDSIKNKKQYSLKDQPDEQALINDENQQKRSKYQIKEGMTDRERYEELKDARITPAQYNPERMAEDIQALTELENTYKSRAEKILKPLAEKFGVFKSYYNEAIELEFNYSKGSLNESVFKQATRAGQFDTFAKMLSCFDEMIKNAVPIEIHKDKYKGTIRSGSLKKVYVLASSIYDKGIVPIQLEVKEFEGQPNKLYITVTLNKIKEAPIMGSRSISKNGWDIPKAASTITLAELFSNINTSDIDFLKYVPDQFLNKSQMEGKREGLRKEREKLESLKQGVRYSLKDQPDDSAESDLIDMSSVRSHEKKVRNARLKTIEALSLQIEQLRQKKKLTSRKLPDQQNLIKQSNNLVRTLLGGKRTKHKLVNIAADNAKAIFGKLKQGDDQEAIERAYITSREIVESLDFVKDHLYIEYKTLRDYLETIRVEKQDDTEEHYGMHTLQSGYLKQNEREGMSANRVYKELRRLCPVLFSEDISNPADQLREIAKVRDSLEPYDLMLSGEAAERLIKKTAASLLDIAYNGTARQIFTDKQKDFFTEELKLLKQQQKEAKNKVEEKLPAR